MSSGGGITRGFLRRVRARLAGPVSALDQFGAESFSQEGEDMVLRDLLADRPQGFYVDVGAHHPRRFSNTAYFQRRGWRGINIDADPEAIADLRRERPADINIPCGVGEEEGEFEFTRYFERALNTFDTRQVARLARDAPRYEISDTRRVRVRRLESILDEHLEPARPIDFLSVDVEGRDEQVIRSNDWERYRPEVVAVEILTDRLIETAAHPTYQFMLDQGYECVAKTRRTAFFTRA